MERITITFKETGEIRGVSVADWDGSLKDVQSSELNDLLPMNLGDAAEIVKLKNELENSVPKSEFEALQNQLDQAKQAIAEIREKGAIEVMAEFQRRVCEQFKVPDWVSFNIMRSNSLSEVSALLEERSVTTDHNRLDEIDARLSVMKAGKDWLVAMEARAVEIVEMSPMPLDITKDELWVLK